MAIESLRSDWLTSGVQDFEYKQYLLLAYLQYVKDHFDNTRLYPPLAELVEHYNNLRKLKENEEELSSLFPKSLKKADMETLRLHYEELVEDDDAMKVVKDLVDFSLPKFRELIDEGRDIYQFVEKNVELDTVGLVPIYKNEGYFFLLSREERDVMIYRYQLSIIEAAEETYRSLKTNFVKKDQSGLSRTLESIKMELTKHFTDLPNPATYLIRPRLEFPMLETVLPIAKRILIREIKPSAA